MTRKNHNKIISVVHPICCGLDVHKSITPRLDRLLAPNQVKARRGPKRAAVAIAHRITKADY